MTLEKLKRKKKKQANKQAVGELGEGVGYDT